MLFPPAQVATHLGGICGSSLLLKLGSPLIEAALKAQKIPVDVMEWGGFGNELGGGTGVIRHARLSKRDGNSCRAQH